jgi:hypothetical protein
VQGVTSSAVRVPPKTSFASERFVAASAMVGLGGDGNVGGGLVVLVELVLAVRFVVALVAREATRGLGSRSDAVGNILVGDGVLGLPGHPVLTFHLAESLRILFQLAFAEALATLGISLTAAVSDGLVLVVGEDGEVAGDTLVDGEVATKGPPAHVLAVPEVKFVDKILIGEADTVADEVESQDRLQYEEASSLAMDLSRRREGDPGQKAGGRQSVAIRHGFKAVAGPRSLTGNLRSGNELYSLHRYQSRRKRAADILASRRRGRR